MGKTLKMAGVVGLATVGLVVGVSTAGASTQGNGDAKAPRANPERSYFCSHPEHWWAGFSMTGTSNDNDYGTWVVTGIRDDPHQTAIGAVFKGTWSVTWYCV